jgi:hypothetical protein
VKLDDIIVKRFETPDEVRTFEKWSDDVSPISGTDFCEVEHFGMVVSGVATCAFKDGEVHELRAGDIFYIGPEPHDSWVVGDKDYISLHFHEAEKYAK